MKTKEELSQYRKEYYRKHKDRYKAYYKLHRLVRNAYGKKYYAEHKEYFKKYYKDNLEKITEYGKQYRELSSNKSSIDKNN